MTQIGEGTAAPFGFGGPLAKGALAVTVVERTSREPVAGVEVSLHGPSAARATTAGDGTARFDGLEPGLYITSAAQDEFEIGHGTEVVVLEPGRTAARTLRIERIMISVAIKRIHVRNRRNVVRERIKTLPREEQVEYGHWWIEVDGVESYGWWPTEPVGLWDTLTGVPGSLNRMRGFGPPSPRDPHHPDAADTEFHPKVVTGMSAAAIKTCIRTFAYAFSGSWSYPVGQNCHSFQEDLMEHCGLEESTRMLDSCYWNPDRAR